ncbi:MAG: MBL fold metallo-hydrolase [Candidatus Pacebacteria bacterium]|nr:MBL fold metallo-hydrolase [Candidatus Paceibacterota bacterium]
MQYEVDILAVGEESKSGDAIALRYGDFVNDPSNQKVVVIDGGFKDSGEELVKRIQNEYGTNYVDVVISTHPDSDHVSGLEVVLDKLAVGELWMHRPWSTNNELKKIVESEVGLIELLSVNKAKKSLRAAFNLEKKAIEKGITIVDPFAGHSTLDGVIHVIGPSVDFYNSLLPDFEKGGQRSIGEKIKSLISEFWHKDELEEPGEDAVSPRNNSSVITVATFGSKNFLFTGDAGVRALASASLYAVSQSFNLATNIHNYQIPHHGSKRNIGPAMLDVIVGPIVSQGQMSGKAAFISAAKDNPKHPSHRVKNAFIRRGVKVSQTCGQSHCFRSDGVPTRPGWGSIVYCEFTNSHEEED